MKKYDQNKKLFHTKKQSCFVTQESENKLNIQAKNESSAVNKHAYQNIDNKYIDTDPISYITDLIMQVSKNITKGHGLSKRGVNALFLFLLTSGLLYNYTQFPQNITEFFKIYAVPLVFLFYSLMDILKNVPFVNNLYVKIFNVSDFIRDTIINNSVSLDELEYYLESIVFTSQQFKDIIEYLIRINQFSPQCQVNLMRNTSLYEVESINYVKDLLLEFNFTSQAVCIFLNNMEARLDYNYLDKLTEKYRDFPTVLFLAGALYMYKIDETNSLYKYGYELTYKKRKLNASNGELYVGGTLILLATTIIYIVSNSSLTSVPLSVNLSGNLSGNLSKPLSGNLNAPLSVNLSVAPIIIPIILLLAGLSVVFGLLKGLIYIHSLNNIRKYLKDKNLDEEVIECIVKDLNDIDYDIL